MFKRVLFQTHWFLGITAGLVLALMGVTGALYSFQAELTDLVSPQTIQTRALHDRVMPMNALMQRLQVAAGDQEVRLVRIELDGRTPSVVLTTDADGANRQQRRFDPASGELIDDSSRYEKAKSFFELMKELHRFLAMGDVGRVITGACTLALLVSCVTGLYLRWPRRMGDWRAWLWLDWARKGRAFQWDLHAAAGTWCMVFFLFLALTGLWWSYDWYREGLIRLLGGEQTTTPFVLTDPPGTQDIDYDRIWSNLQATAGPGLQMALLTLPVQPGDPVTGTYRMQDASHSGAFDRAYFDPATGAVLAHKRYADQTLGQQLLESIYSLHVGEYFGLTGRIVLMLASLVMPLFLITGVWLYLDRRGKQRQARRERRALAGSGAGAGGAQTGDAWLIGFASQSGTAEQLAWRTAGQLQAAGHAVTVQPLGQVQEPVLTQARQALFVLSTFGEGDPPDSARGFARRMANSRPDLSDLRYAVLALGDRQYERFCGFGRAVDTWLADRGAQPWFASVEVDSGDTQALQDWQQRLGALTGITSVSEPVSVPFAPCRLVERERLNRGSEGAPVYRIALLPESAMTWQAGDVLEVQVPDAVEGEQGAATVTRDYSIASLPADGRIELIVRQAVREDGRPGLGSGWLTMHVPLEGWVQARVRTNRSFHAPEDARPMILVGNGTGVAGLRSLLKARAAAGQHRNWLLFGERSMRCDFFCGDEIDAWRARGVLARLDLAFSRDQAHKVYVQDRLRAAADELRAWVGQGASIYVCGSLEGMAGGVDAVLREVLGEDAVLALIDAGRYRRDVY